MKFDRLSNEVIGAALKVHSALGPGLYEEVYKVCLKHQLVQSGLKVLTEVGVSVNFASVSLDVGYRIDMLIEDTLIVELKSVPNFTALHRAQLLTYLKFAEKEVGLLFNFNTVHLKDGILRMHNKNSMQHRSITSS